MDKQHPQPAFDLLTSLPLPAEDTFLMNWDGGYPEKIDGERGEPIEEHPELWDFHELPDCLDDLTTEEYVSSFVGPELNLNAIAIGLGLENAEYEPQVFAGLIYHPEGVEGTVLCSGAGLILGISETPESSKEAIVTTIKGVEELELIENISDGWKDGIETKQVEHYRDTGDG
jgi:hypothetical protein